MPKALYFDCFSGASGDMILGALLDAGLPLGQLKAGLDSLHLGLQIKTAKVLKNGLTATSFEVVAADEEHHTHSRHEQTGQDDHTHADVHTHTAGQGHHHRGLSEITAIINSSDLPAAVKERSCAIFRTLGEVEAEAHGVPLEEVHFHELGALDTIVDIVGTLLALDIMGIQECYASPLPAGSGTVKTAHGVLPVPAPATLKILAKTNAPVVAAPPSDNPPGEMLTPTGAVLITSLAKFERPDIRLEAVGCGAGFKDFKNWPNILRVWIGRTVTKPDDTAMVQLETNIDDMSPQVSGYLMEKLLEAGAADVWFTPIQMKKNRPAVMLSVLAVASLERLLCDIIFKETTTLGIRIRNVSRQVFQREVRSFQSSLGTVNLKIKLQDDRPLWLNPEYDDVQRIARAHNLSFLEAQRIITAEAWAQLKPEQGQ